MSNGDGSSGAGDSFPRRGSSLCGTGDGGGDLLTHTGGGLPSAAVPAVTASVTSSHGGEGFPKRHRQRCGGQFFTRTGLSICGTGFGVGAGVCRWYKHERD